MSRRHARSINEAANDPQTIEYASRLADKLFELLISDCEDGDSRNIVGLHEISAAGMLVASLAVGKAFGTLNAQCPPNFQDGFFAAMMKSYIAAHTAVESEAKKRASE